MAQPPDPLARGLALEREGRPEEALQAYREAAERHPAYAPAQALLGALLIELGRTGEALEPLRAAARLRPDQAAARNNLAYACLLLGMYAEAEAEARAALSLDPAHARARATHAQALLRQGALTRGERALALAAAATPASAPLQLQLANTRLDLGLVAEALEAFDAAIALRPADVAQIDSARLLAMHYDPARSPQELFEAHREWAARNTVAAAPRPSRAAARDRLRIGYVSPRMHRSSPAGLLAGVLEHHDRAAIEAVCYACSEIADDMTQRLRRAASQWREVTRLDDAQLAQLMRDDGIDIAVDLAGHTPGHRLGAFARRPAPVAVSWLDYFDTTGVGAMDTLITDRWHSPEGGGQRFTETLVRLPGLRFCWEPPHPSPAVVPAAADADRPFTFGSFNRLTKLSEATLALWCQALRAVPGSRIVVKSAALNNIEEHAILRARFARHGIDAGRIEARGASPHQAMLAEYAGIDVALDSFPYNGCIVTLEALWMGRPVLTIAGDTMVSRQSAAILACAGLDEYIAPDAPAFVAKAAALAADRAALAAASMGLRDRIVAAGITDFRRFTSALEVAYREMWSEAVRA